MERNAISIVILGIAAVLGVVGLVQWELHGYSVYDPMIRYEQQNPNTYPYARTVQPGEFGEQEQPSCWTNQDCPTGYTCKNQPANFPSLHEGNQEGYWKTCTPQ